VGKVRFFVRDCTPKWKMIFPVGNCLSRSARFSAHLLLLEPEKAINMGNSRYFQIGRGLAITQSHQDIVRDRQRRISLIPRVVKRDQIFVADPLFGEGGSMYLLFGPSMAALVVIAVIQLRDTFVASR
jgi:hypothetical protein